MFPAHKISGHHTTPCPQTSQGLEPEAVRELPQNILHTYINKHVACTEHTRSNVQLDEKYT